MLQQPKDLLCDGCSRPAGKSVRWCGRDKCMMAICPACLLDGHKDHADQIGSYHKAARDAKTSMETFRSEINNEAAQLATKRAASTRLEKEIVERVEVDKYRIRKRVEEAEKLSETLQQAMDELEKLGKKPLNGRTIIEREHAIKHVEALCESLPKRQEMIVKKLRQAETVLDKFYSGISVEMN